MKVLVDTSVWSCALRTNTDTNVSARLSELIKEARVEIIGPIRQELLSEVRTEKLFNQLNRYLRAFPDIFLDTDDYIEAASVFNRCRKKGIQGSHTDFLICALAMRHNFSIFTLDKDFTHYACVLPLLLF